MQYMSQCVHFSYKDWRRGLAEEGRDVAARVQFDIVKKSWRKIFAEKTEKIKIPVDR